MPGVALMRLAIEGHGRPRARGAGERVGFYFDGVRRKLASNIKSLARMNKSPDLGQATHERQSCRTCGE